MIIPERLWRPSVKDIKADFNPTAFQYTQVVNAITVSATAGMGPAFGGRQVPDDKVLILQHCSGLLATSGAETAAKVELWLMDAAAANILTRLEGRFVGTDFVAAAAQSVFAAFRGNPFVFSDRQANIVVSTGKSAGVSNASIVISVGGVLIPRGNWQLP